METAKNQIQIGEDITIFEDPFSETKVEGRATILKCLKCQGKCFDNQIVYRCLVMFKGKYEMPVERTILVQGG